VRVLITGFGAFPGAPFNPSAALARALSRRRRPALADVAFSVHIFPTAYAAIDLDLPKLLKERPDIVLMFGLAAQRKTITVEVRARNAISVLFPDANGVRPASGVIAKEGPAALPGRAPFQRLVGAARAAGGSARLSRDAGRYVCNYAYWRALALSDGKGPLVQFVHIPAPARAAVPVRRRKRGKKPSSGMLRVTAEAILVALIAARRR
jgi:pyroglutamyl-peptidase